MNETPSPGAAAAQPDPAKREQARGQCRTTETDWSKTPAYIRFRYERARDLLPREGPVFELGCGIGHGVAFLARSRPDLDFVGLDVSPAAIEYGREHFGHLPNLSLEAIDDLEGLADRLPHHAFLVAFEVLEHLDDQQLNRFKHDVMRKIDSVVFSFPYDEKNIEGTEHLQSFDIFAIFAIFPGFETVFIRRHSLKFIGFWRRADRRYVREHLGVAREGEAIAAIANIEPPTSAKPAPPRYRRLVRKLGRDPQAFFRDSRIGALRVIGHLLDRSRP